MALSRTQRVTAASGQGVTSLTTGSFTPAANTLLAIGGGGNRGDFNTSYGFTASGGSLSYTPRVYATVSGNWDFGNDGQYSCFAGWWTAPVGGSPSSMTVTLACAAGADAQSIGVVVEEMSGYDTGAPTGAVGDGFGARVSNTPPASGAVSDTLSAAPAASSIVLALMALDNDTPSNNHIDTGAGWTQTAELQPGDYANVHVQARTGSTSTSFGWDGADTDYSRAWAALEIKAAAVTAAPRFQAHIIG